MDIAKRPQNYDLDTPILNIPCYEPAGRRIKLDGEALTRNTLLTGAIGSGKTSTLNHILQQLVKFRAAEAEAKIGLIIFDFKQDGTADRVHQWARAAGRADDVEVLDESSDTRLELFENFDSLEDLEATVETLLAAAPKEKGENQYWEYARHKRLTQALGLYRLVHEGPLYGPEALVFVQQYLKTSSSQYNNESLAEIQTFHRLVERMPVDTSEALRMEVKAIEAGLAEWKGLDVRTASNEISTMSNFLNLLAGSSKYKYLGGREKKVIRVEEVVEAGKILVVSIPALRQPSLAAVLGRLIKSRFYAALQQRQLNYESSGRLAGIIMDEYPLVATGGETAQSDVTQLQAMRSMRGFAIAATQGFEALNRVLGPSEVTALLAQIDQHFLFRSKEAAVAGFTESLWGDRYRARAIEGAEGLGEPGLAVFPDGDELQEKRYVVERSPRVGLPELARLEPGEAWVWTPETQESLKPFWLVPLHTKQTQSEHSVLDQPSTSQLWESNLRRALAGPKQPKSREESIDQALDREGFLDCGESFWDE